MRTQIFDFIGRLSFSEKCETSKALLCAGHPPGRVRQISGFAKVSGRLKRFQTAFYMRGKALNSMPTRMFMFVGDVYGFRFVGMSGQINHL